MQLVGMLPVSHKLSYKPESIWSVLLSKFTALQNITREMTVENPGRILWRQFYSERVERKKFMSRHLKRMHTLTSLSSTFYSCTTTVSSVVTSYPSVHINRINTPANFVAFIP